MCSFEFWTGKNLWSNDRRVLLTWKILTRHYEEYVFAPPHPSNAYEAHFILVMEAAKTFLVSSWLIKGIPWRLGSGQGVRAAVRGGVYLHHLWQNFKRDVKKSGHTPSVETCFLYDCCFTSSIGAFRGPEEQWYRLNWPHARFDHLMKRFRRSILRFSLFHGSTLSQVACHDRLILPL